MRTKYPLRRTQWEIIDKIIPKFRGETFTTKQVAELLNRTNRGMGAIMGSIRARGAIEHPETHQWRFKPGFIEWYDLQKVDP